MCWGNKAPKQLLRTTELQELLGALTRRRLSNMSYVNHGGPRSTLTTDERIAEATRILERLKRPMEIAQAEADLHGVEPKLDGMSSKAWSFVEGLLMTLELSGKLTTITDSQIFWLRDISAAVD